MIFTKYLVNKIFKNQVFVLLLLLFVFISQKFIRVFDTIFDADVPKFLIFVFFGLSIPEIFKLILPISLFFGILITFNSLHTNNEIIAMYSCGLGNNFIIRSVLFLSIVTTVVSVINVMFISPFCIYYQNNLLFQYRSNFNKIKLLEKKFHILKRVNSVFFIDNVYEKQFRDIFLVHITPSGIYSVVVADNGYIKEFYDGAQWIIMGSGYCYSWSKNIVFSSGFYVNSFDQYKIFLDSKVRDYKSNELVVEMSIYQLWCSSTFEARAELHWRLTLIIVVFIMAMIIFPLSVMKLNSSYLLSVFPAMILYFLFFILQIFLRSYISKGHIEPLWVWSVNFFYILVALILNFWNSVVFRNFRWKLRVNSKQD